MNADQPDRSDCRNAPPSREPTARGRSTPDAETQPVRAAVNDWILYERGGTPVVGIVQAIVPGEPPVYMTDRGSCIAGTEREVRRAVRSSTTSTTATVMVTGTDTPVSRGGQLLRNYGAFARTVRRAANTTPLDAALIARAITTLDDANATLPPLDEDVRLVQSSGARVRNAEGIAEGLAEGLAEGSADATAGRNAESLPWRCYHCDEVFTKERAAREHFGMDEHQTPGCLLKLNAGERLLLGTIRDLTARNTELLARAHAAEREWEMEMGLRAEITRYFGVSDAWSCWNLFDSMKGRALAAEEQVDQLLEAAGAPAAEYLVDRVEALCRALRAGRGAAPSLAVGGSAETTTSATHEYRTTSGPRKTWDGGPDLTTEGWEPDPDRGDTGEGWGRFEHHEERYWRRRIDQPSNPTALEPTRGQ